MSENAGDDRTADTSADAQGGFQKDDKDRLAVKDLDTWRASSNPRRVVPKRALDSLNVNVAFEIDRLTMRIREITELHQGEIISLDRSVGEPIDIRVNGALLARGEIVALRNNQYGVRVTEIVAAEQDALTE